MFVINIKLHCLMINICGGGVVGCTSILKNVSVLLIYEKNIHYGFN